MDTNNHVALTGRVSVEPVTRELPSGDRVSSFRIIVDRTARRRRTKQRVDVFECDAWTAALRRQVERLAPGDTVEITGALRRQFSRGAVSYVSVDLSSVRAAPPAARRAPATA